MIIEIKEAKGGYIVQVEDDVLIFTNVRELKNYVEEEIERTFND